MANISSGQGLGIRKPGQSENIKPAKMVDKAAKAGKIKSIKVKFGKGK